MTNQLQPTQSPLVLTQSFVSAMMSLAIAVALLAWAYSIARKAVKGEEVEYPLGG